MTTTGRLGIAAMVLGGLTLLIAWIPIIGMLGVPVAGIGFVLAIIALVQAKIGQRVGLGMPVAGALCCGLSIALSYYTTMTRSSLQRGPTTPIDAPSRSSGRPGAGSTTPLGPGPYAPTLPPEDERRNLRIPPG